MQISGATALCALLLLALSLPVAAQNRDFRAERLVLDDGNSNTIIIRTPAGPITGGTLTVPDPGGAGMFLISNPSGGSQSVSGDILPGVDDTYDLGSGASRWQDIFASGDVSIGGQTRYVETGGGTDYVGFQAPAAVAANQIWTLPAADGANGQVLTTNGSGILSWGAAGGGGTVSTNSTLVGDGSGGSPLGLNLANSNTWTGATQTFAPTDAVGVRIDETHLALTNSDNAARQVRWQEASGNGASFVSLEAAPSMAGNTSYVFPPADGSNGHVLTTDGSGNLSWQPAASPPGGVGSSSIIYKGTDETVNSVNPRVLQNDDDLTYALTANTTYHVDGIIFATETNGNPGLRIAFDVPTGTTIRISYFGFNEAGSNQERGILTADATESAQLALNTTITAFRISGVVEVGATAGDIDFQWIGNSTTTTHQATVQQRSFLRYTRID